MTDQSFYHRERWKRKSRTIPAETGYSSRWAVSKDSELGIRNSGLGRGGVMSAKNGDKSRHQINRKRVVLRRAKIRDLVKAAKSDAAPVKAEAK
jgi:hypothetical protein